MTKWMVNVLRSMVRTMNGWLDKVDPPKVRRLAVRREAPFGIPITKVLPEQIVSIIAQAHDTVKLRSIVFAQRTVAGEPVLGCVVRELLLGTHMLNFSNEPMVIDERPVILERTMMLGQRLKIVVENRSDRVIFVGGNCDAYGLDESEELA